MQNSTLETLRALAQRDEDRAAAQLSAALRQLERVQQIAHQLQSFGTEYRMAALSPGGGAGGAGFSTDALAFGQRLHGTASEQQARVREQEQRCEAARQTLAQARHRADGLQRLWQKAQQVERLAEARRAERRIDELVASRWGRRVGTERAVM
ncbi:flagellar export protein FliJ [Hydrogenophaga sp.]|uniref:flagellar export protein FliJ n=1 Tax=Hydrogenophaga sp. TaxID=1904254 RepID=UPI003F6C373E